MESPMKINDVVKMFQNPEKYFGLKVGDKVPLEVKTNKVSFNQLLQEFCAFTNIRNWEQFKKSARIKSFNAPMLKREIVFFGDNRFPRPEYGWSASELEYAFEKEMSTEELDKVDQLKKLFGGEILTKRKVKKDEVVRNYSHSSGHVGGTYVSKSRPRD